MAQAKKITRSSQKETPKANSKVTLHNRRLPKSSNTIRTIRVNNLRLLVEEYGTTTAVAEKAGTSNNYLYQLLGDAESYKDRGIGNSLARKLEIGCKKPEGWMDVDHGKPGKESELLAIYGKLSKAKQAQLLELAQELRGTKAK